MQFKELCCLSGRTGRGLGGKQRRGTAAELFWSELSELLWAHRDQDESGAVRTYELCAWVP